MIVNCRKCKTPKWKTDKCQNPDCQIIANRIPTRKGLPKTSRVIGLTNTHGFHSAVRKPGMIRDYWGNAV